MRPELETYHQIDRYFRKELTGEELAEFEQKLRIDSEFAQEVKTQEFVNSVVVGSVYSDLRSQMSVDLPEIKHSETNFGKWLWLALGSLGLILGIIAFILLNKENSSGSLNNSKEEIQNKIQPKENTEARIESELDQRPVSVLPKESKRQKVANSVMDQNSKTENSQTTAITDEPLPVLETPVLTESKPESKVEEAIKPDCKTSNIVLTPTISPSCNTEKNGKVSFVGVPEHLKISKEKNSKATVQPVFYNMASGSHTFYISDENGCHFTQEIVVPEKNCKPNKFAFNPDLGETWKVPVSEQDEFVLTVKSRSGQVVYSNNNVNEWAGNSQTNGTLEPGIYIYLIEYTDGRKEGGQVSIVK